MFLGWKWLPVDDAGMPVDYETQWVAECFILFFWVIYIGEVRSAES